VARAAPGAWSEPIASKYGFHLVRVIERQGEGPASFEARHDDLRLAYLIARREDATAEYLRRAFARYRVSVGDRPMLALPRTARTAARNAPSAED
jgi:parvulin-like peptidyl-prolyl isomerase